MRLIAHRGNLKGPSKTNENNPGYISNALNKGYDVETDIWFNESGIFLGHDEPQYKIKIDFLKNSKLWCHAKDLKSLYFLLNNKIQCFWHQEDNFTLTSNNLIWTYPGNQTVKKTIIVCRDFLETKENFKKKIYGICSDYVGEL